MPSGSIHRINGERPVWQRMTETNDDLIHCQICIYMEIGRLVCLPRDNIYAILNASMSGTFHNWLVFSWLGPSAINVVGWLAQRRPSVDKLHFSINHGQEDLQCYSVN